MKSVITFIRATLTGGLFILLPIFLLGSIVLKAHSIVEKIMAPLMHLLPDQLIGVPAGKLVAALVLVLICFLCGMLFRIEKVKKGLKKVEENLLSRIPGYNLLKMRAADALGDKTDIYASTVMVQIDEGWKIGLLIEEDAEHSIVFFPDAPRGDSGEVRVVLSSVVSKIQIPTRDALNHLKNFGRGTLGWINKD